ncbi:MAG: chloride channel protein [Thermoprotei archaeon]
MDAKELRRFAKGASTSAVIGLVSGASALTFELALRLLSWAFDALESATRLDPLLSHPLFTAIGTTASALLLASFLSREERRGLDRVIEVYHKGGKLRPLLAPIYLLASVITIGSGGSAGSESPTGVTSAGLTSLASRALKLSPEETRRALAIAAGAGIGAILKAPIGGAVFATEFLYKGKVEVKLLPQALLASLVAYLVFGSVFGFSPLLGSVDVAFSPAYLPFMAAFGALAGVVATAYVVALQLAMKFLAKHRIGPTVGGLGAGVMAALFPQVAGEGLRWIRLAVSGVSVTPYVALLPFVKLLATSLTLGSSAAGGLVVPAIFVGAFLGLDFGALIHSFFPWLAVEPFVVAGIAAVFAAAGKVPVSMTVFAVEMTWSPQLLPCVALAVLVAYLTSGSYTVYETQAGETYLQSLRSKRTS